MARFAAKFLTAAAALPLAAGLLLAPAAAHAEWRGGYGGYGGYRGGYGGYHRGPGAGAIVGGALLGLGVGALLAAPYLAPPPAYYAPPPAYYPPAGYAYAPGYAPGYAPAYAPPPGYYQAPAYYGGQ